MAAQLCRMREHVTAVLRGHEQEVCGLKWSPSGEQLASGGNDNLLHIWSAAGGAATHRRALLLCMQSLCMGSMTKQCMGQTAHALIAPSNALLQYQGGHLRRLTAHTAAVKALAWCPFQSNLLASGGGTADRCIRFWNTHTGALLNSIDTHSQVRLACACCLEILPSHLRMSLRCASGMLCTRSARCSGAGTRRRS